ncbi:DUF2059 domain-containing protein [Phormidium yuhuli AB48]|uniref:DUF2059 domain-containing protein n=1 Tax=Phormidium yuhuli AB48 TaxID=2940671 RepID=A0ABY5AN80_9CYAN|nr:DUF2059 domain-containing protein [Phormidium yuhuli]USR90649.1 DUF2059 domain-containing protein [Phormidium yuhuli AB48]
MKRTVLSLTLVNLLAPLSLGMVAVSLPSLGARPVMAQAPNQIFDDPEISPEREALIHEIIRATNEVNVMVESVRLSLEAMPGFPSQLREEYLGRFEADYVDLVTPIYAEYYSQEELEALLRFYQSDAGRAIAERAPDVARNAFSRVSVWAELNILDILQNMGN